MHQNFFLEIITIIFGHPKWTLRFVSFLSNFLLKSLCSDFLAFITSFLPLLQSAFLFTNTAMVWFIGRRCVQLWSGHVPLNPPFVGRDRLPLWHEWRLFSLRAFTAASQRQAGDRKGSRCKASSGHFKMSPFCQGTRKESGSLLCRWRPPTLMMWMETFFAWGFHGFILEASRGQESKQAQSSSSYFKMSPFFQGTWQESHIKFLMKYILHTETHHIC